MSVETVRAEPRSAINANRYVPSFLRRRNRQPSPPEPGPAFLPSPGGSCFDDDRLIFGGRGFPQSFI